jgi:hypothetical protein
MSLFYEIVDKFLIILMYYLFNLELYQLANNIISVS